MRRRLREQRRVREALLLDLGALVFELHRHGRREPELLQAKASELSQVDAEVRGLTEALDADLGVVELTAAGIAGSCESCGALLSVDTRFCPSCGAAVRPGLEPRRAEAPQLRVEQPTDEYDQWEDMQPEAAGEEPEPVFEEEAWSEDFGEQESFDDEPELAEEVEPEPDAEEPEPELDAEEPEPEPAVETPKPGLATAPWLQTDTPDSAPAPEPVKVRRKMGRLERTLRGKPKDDS